MPRSTTQRIFLYSVLTLFLAALHYLVTLPTRYLLLEFHDDGESLYHTLNVLQGQVPYLHDHSHHFLGYIIPYILLARLLGFSVSLVKSVALVHQVVTGVGVFMCSRILTAPVSLALAAASLAISARQPWEVGYFIQYQLNTLFVFILYFSIRTLHEEDRIIFPVSASTLCGIAFLFDQRAIVFASLPLFTLLLRPTNNRRRLITILSVSFLGFVLPAGSALLYLWNAGALDEFFEQTIRFPALYRVGSKGFGELALDAIHLHRHLLSTPLLTTFGALGICSIGLRIFRANNSSQRPALILMLATLVPMAILPSLGSRDYGYYTITWLPYLSIASTQLPTLFSNIRFSFVHRFSKTIVWIPVGFALLSSLTHRNWQAEQHYTGDGSEKVVTFLQDNLSALDSIYVWGYRPDLYVRLNRLSPYPMVNQMMVHPDEQIVGDANRERHIHPEYSEQLLSALKNSPPTFLVTINEDKMLWSPSRDLIVTLTRKEYVLVFELEKTDFRGLNNHFKIYQKVERSL